MLKKKLLALTAVACGALLCVGFIYSAGTIKRVSASAGGGFANNDSFEATISGNGRYVAFASNASDLVPGDTNNSSDVFVKDLVTGAIERVSVSDTGLEANSGSKHPSLSYDGRYVAFDSFASNLTPTDGSEWDIFVKDRLSGAIERISVSPTDIGGYSEGATISADGRYVTFASGKPLLTDDTGWADVYIKDRQTAQIWRASNGISGGNGNNHSSYPAMSADGRFVAFSSTANNLVPSDTNGYEDIFIWDRLTGQTEMVSVSSAEVQGTGLAGAEAPSISADGRFVAFRSNMQDITPTHGGGFDVFLRDRQQGTTELISMSSDEVPSDWYSYQPSVSADGRFVAFTSQGNNLVPGDQGFDRGDVYIRDRLLGTTEYVNAVTADQIPWSYGPSISASGRFVVYQSDGTNQDGADANGKQDVFVRDFGLIFNIDFAVTQVTGGNNLVGTVTLNGPAPAGGLTVELSDDSASAVTPASIVIPAGASSAEFTVTTKGVDFSVNVVFTARVDGVPKSKTVKVAKANLTSLVVSPTEVYGGTASTVKVRATLNGKTGPSGLNIDLSSSSAFASVPATAFVESGKTFVEAPVTHQAVSNVKTVNFTAVAGLFTRKATLTINPLDLQSVTLNRTKVPGGSATVVTGTVTLASAPPVGVDVQLTSSNPSLVGVPATVRVNPGKTTATFNVTHAPVATDTNVTISGDLGTYTRTVVLLVQAPTVKAISLNPSTVVGGQSSQATVTLTAPAPAGGVVVTLSTSNTKANCPSSVLIPEGATQSTFTVNTVSVNTQAGSYVRVTIGPVTRSALLTINP